MCLAIAGVPSNYFVSQRNQMRYFILMGLVTSLHGCAYCIPVVLYYFCLLWQKSAALYFVIAFQNSLSMSKVMSQVGQPWSSWTTRTIERSKVFYKTEKSIIFGHNVDCPWATQGKPRKTACFFIPLHWALLLQDCSHVPKEIKCILKSLNNKTTKSPTLIDSNFQWYLKPKQDRRKQVKKTPPDTEHSTDRVFDFHWITESFRLENIFKII